MAKLSSQKFPTAATDYAEAPYDDEAWSSPGSVVSNNTACATITAATFDTPAYSRVIKTGVFGFSIPTTPEPACITGIQVDIGKYNTNGPVKDALVMLSKNGTTGIGNNYASAGSWGTRVIGTNSYGGSNSLWGASFNAADINGTGFGVFFAAQADGADCDAYVDFISVTVYYDTLGETRDMSARRSRFVDTNDLSGGWRKTIGVGLGTSGSVGTAFAKPIVSAAAATGAYTSSGTAVFALGSAGTLKMEGHTMGTAREVYFCGTSGTARQLPLGCTSFAHYYVHTRGYSTTSFTVGTSPTGTGGTQCNFTGTVGTHCVWTKNP